MAVITPVAVDTAGEAVTSVAASVGGDTIATAGKPTRLQITNGSGSPITVTLAGVVPCSQGATHNVVLTVPATTTESVQVPSQCINAANGNVGVTYSAVTTVTVAATS